MGYHIISLESGGIRYKAPHVYDDSEFDALVAQFHGYMPAKMSAYHFQSIDQLLQNPVMENRKVWNVPVQALACTHPLQPMKLKDKDRRVSSIIERKFGSFLLIRNNFFEWLEFRYVDGRQNSIVTDLQPVPITLKEASTYVGKYHRHNAPPHFHKFSVCLRVDGEPEPVGVAIASTPKSRQQMNGTTLEINRCCSDIRYADVCSKLYAMAIRVGREMGYRRFLTYTLPEESGSSLRAVGFQLDGVTRASQQGWNSKSRSRNTESYPKGPKLRWVLERK